MRIIIGRSKLPLIKGNLGYGNQSTVFTRIQSAGVHWMDRLTFQLDSFSLSGHRLQSFLLILEYHFQTYTDTDVAYLSLTLIL